MEEKLKIFLCEDDENLGMLLREYLQAKGFDTDLFPDGEAGFKGFVKTKYDLCIVDVMMPKIDGFTLAEKIIKINPEVPFVFLTARKLKDDKIKGLKLGADDYIVKPFEADEMVLRLNNILKRSEQKSSVISSEEIAIGNYTFNPKRLELQLGHSIQRVTEKEGTLISFLFKNKNQLLKREEILKAVWGSDDFFSGRSMDVFISRLRKYFNEDSRISIESIRNIGLEFKLKN